MKIEEVLENQLQSTPAPSEEQAATYNPCLVFVCLTTGNLVLASTHNLFVIMAADAGFDKNILIKGLSDNSEAKVAGILAILGFIVLEANTVCYVILKDFAKQKQNKFYKNLNRYIFSANIPAGIISFNLFLGFCTWPAISLTTAFLIASGRMEAATEALEGDNPYCPSIQDFIVPPCTRSHKTWSFGKITAATTFLVLFSGSWYVANYNLKNQFYNANDESSNNISQDLADYLALCLGASLAGAGTHIVSAIVAKPKAVMGAVELGSKAVIESVKQRSTTLWDTVNKAASAISDVCRGRVANENRNNPHNNYHSIN
ncbi:MAG: hypothetical protein WC756_10175 [Taibaiella sp.]|jgi:hypothetical protein